MRITALVILAGALCACDTDATGVGVGIGVVAPTAASANVAVSINREFASASFGDGVCASTAFFTPRFDVVVVAGAPVRVEHVTIQMIDGSVLGGPMVPIPQPAPVTGTVFLAAGARRTFTFQPSIACASPLPRTVRASVVCLNQAGARQTTVVDAPFR